MRRQSVRVRVLALAFCALVVPGAVATACVDGMTPDCSDPKTPCGPSGLDGSSDRIEAAVLEATAPIDSALDSPAEAATDANLDAGDGG
jgi:hypothetical protein